MALREVETPQYVRELAELFPPQGHWTEAAYLGLPETNRLIELEYGQLRVIEMPTDRHQSILGQLFGLIWQFLRQSRLGVVRSAGIRVRLQANLVREPDIVFMLNAHLARIEDQVWGPPDLAVEIHSPGTREVDRGEKFREYAEAGVTEYWMVDPDAQTIEVYALEASTYVLHGIFKPNDVLTSGLLPNLNLAVAEVFAE